ncbi:MAG: hypothetical protein J7623_12240 [Chitinophaga sp.]|uniref:hypothetical protein n=1 Tax=Chitinophaga sp. TaxID=1869181 RepID=UPI001B2488DE|nr:hypothetical protein [Chitinophaga sp.]MBO9729396.1 hypothetical protein [Chitinophaga sp.]
MKKFTRILPLLFVIISMSCKKDSSPVYQPLNQRSDHIAVKAEGQGLAAGSITTEGLPYPFEESPLYDYYNSANGDRFLSLDANFSDPGWVRVGVGFGAYPQPISHIGTVPVYEYYNNVTRDHAYSLDPNDPGILGYPNWYRNTPDAVFHVFPNNSRPGTVAVYSYYNASITAHLYSIDPDIQTKYPDWGQKFVAWYAWPPQ